MPQQLQLEPIDIPDDETAEKVYVCPAHPYLDREIKELKQDIKDVKEDNKKDNEKFKEEMKTMLKPAVDFFKEKQAVNRWLQPWKEWFWKVLSGILIAVIIAMIYFFTPL